MIKRIFTSHIDRQAYPLVFIVIYYLLFIYSAISSAGEPLHNEPIKPIPLSIDVNPEKVKLGRELFHDTLLSADNTISCASCHNLSDGSGSDGIPVSIGIHGRKGQINSPTIFNSFWSFRQFWDGRSETLKDQVGGPITNPKEMGSNWPRVLAKLHAHPTYPDKFNDIYSNGINQNNVKDVIAEYEKSLITPNSPFDLYLKGNSNAITAQEKEGYRLFKHYGCTACHQGTNVGGNMFQVFGIINHYFKERGNITEADYGRFNITGNRSDMHMFKVPSLRMAKYSAPYLHDGSQKTLRDAVDIMFKYQLGRQAPANEKDAIVAFIKSLAGEHKEIKKQ